MNRTIRREIQKNPVSLSAGEIIACMFCLHADMCFRLKQLLAILSPGIVAQSGRL